MIASGKPFRPSTTKDVFDAAVLQLVHDAQPKFRALGLLDPQAEDLFGSVGPNPARDVDGFVAHHAFVAHLDPDGVEEDQCIERLQRPVLPFGDLLEDGARDRADEIGGDVEPVEIAQMTLDFANAHAARI